MEPKRHREDVEPVAYLYERDDGSKDLVLNCNGEYARRLIELGATETPLYTHPIRNDAVVEALREALNPIGAADCPRCGRDTPHRHEPDETSKGFEPNLWSRLEKLADALDTPPHDFYAAARSAFGGAIDDLNYFGYLARDLRKTVTRVRAALAAMGEQS